VKEKEEEKRINYFQYHAGSTKIKVEGVEVIP
jgi:hypothetical protein